MIRSNGGNMIDPRQAMRDLQRLADRVCVLILGWNLGEAVVSIGAGVVAGSTALLGYGIDSLIECLSGSILLWRLRHGEKGERREH
jgi:divalent metal cation (Fe/Co/Zn/Cd) transporter